MSETEIRQFDRVIGSDEDVAQREVAMHQSICVEVGPPLCNAPNVTDHLPPWKGSVPTLWSYRQLLDAGGMIIEHNAQFFRVRIHITVQHPSYVLVWIAPQKLVRSDFASCGIRIFVLCFDRHNIASKLVHGLIHPPVRSSPDRVTIAAYQLVT